MLDGMVTFVLRADMVTWRRRVPHMQQLPSTGDSPNAGAVSLFWGSWLMRGSLFIGQISLLILATSLTPAEYFVRLGADIGLVMIIGTVLLWLLLWFARTRTTVLLFCGLALAQSGLTALVAYHFRTEDRVMRAVVAEAAKRHKQYQTQIATFHLERVFEMLTPGNQFHSEELPELLERARAANAVVRKMQSEERVWLQEAEKRIASVSAEGARDIRRGVDRAVSEGTTEISEAYFGGIEELVDFLIHTKNRYRSTANGLRFDRPAEADAYKKRLDTLAAMEKQINVALEVQRSSQ
jgi:AcrR family transcriptional regulator